jgi:acyl-coenzyme A thioesterase PaaI-like protein
MTEKEIRTIRTSKGIREHTYLGCPLTRNRSAWCFRICTPDPEGTGKCGRVAPHSLLSSTQMAITKHGERKRKEDLEHFQNLERIYLAAPYNEFHEPGIRVSAGQADIVIPIRDKLVDPAGIPGTVILKAMNDSANFAVSSIVERHHVLTTSFQVSLTGTIPRGEIIARGRFVGMSGKKYLAESMLTDADGREIGRGEGAFIVSNIPLGPPESIS